MNAIQMFIVFVSSASVVACAATQPQVEYKTQVIDSSCSKFGLIKIPEDDLPKVSDVLKQRIYAHDHTYVATCSTPAK